MKRYKIRYSEISTEDLYELTRTIIEKYKSPLTSKKYISELMQEIMKLKFSAESIPICTQKSVIRKYGSSSR